MDAASVPAPALERAVETTPLMASALSTGAAGPEDVLRFAGAAGVGVPTEACAEGDGAMPPLLSGTSALTPEPAALPLENRDLNAFMPLSGHHTQNVGSMLIDPQQGPTSC